MPGAAIPRGAASSTVHDLPLGRLARQTPAPARFRAPTAGWIRSRMRAGAATETPRRLAGGSAQSRPPFVSPPDFVRADAPPSETVAALPWRIARRAAEVAVRPCVDRRPA